MMVSRDHSNTIINRAGATIDKQGGCAELNANWDLVKGHESAKSIKCSSCKNLSNVGVLHIKINLH